MEHHGNLVLRQLDIQFDTESCVHCQMCVLLPVAKLLSLSGEVTLIWWAFPIAELASVLLTSYFLVRIYRKVICHIGEPVVQDA